MNHKKLNILLSALTVVLGLLMAVSGVAANNLLTKKAAELSKLKAKSQVALDLQDSLKQNKADIAKYSELNTIAKAVVPQDKNQAQTVSEIVNMARESGITKLSSITFPASTLGGTRSTQTKSALTQVTPVLGIPGVYILPITVTQASTEGVPYDKLIAFLKALENNRRTAQVSSINIQPDPKNSSIVSFTLIINEYIKP